MKIFIVILFSYLIGSFSSAYVLGKVSKNIDYQLDHGTFNNDSVLKSYRLIKDNIDKVNEENIKMELINAEHIYELNSLNWRFSFLLRIFK